MAYLCRRSFTKSSKFAFHSSGFLTYPSTPQTDALKSATPQPTQPTQPTTVASTVTNQSDESPPLPPYLSRPIGVLAPPCHGRFDVTQFKDTVIDKDVRMQERKHILKQMGTSYYGDMIRLSRFGPKDWVAPPALIRPNRALYFPNIKGVSLKDKSTIETADMLPGRISVIALLNSRLSTEHVDSFTKSTLQKFDQDPDFQFIQIFLQENIMRSFVVSMFTSNLRKTVPEKYQSTYMISHQNMEYIRESIGFLNQYVGYVYLVDEECKIRWAGGAFATEEETNGLVACTDVLLKRAKQQSPST